MEYVNFIMRLFGYFVFTIICLVLTIILLIIILTEMETWYIFSPKQKFALLPKIVWNMKCKNYHNSLIWLCWYWDGGEAPFNSKYYILTDDEEALMEWHRFTRTYTNSW